MIFSYVFDDDILWLMNELNWSLHKKGVTEILHSICPWLKMKRKKFM